MDKPKYRFSIKVGNMTNSYNLNAEQGDYEAAAKEMREFNWVKILKNLDLAWIEEVK
jgi:hypothetical protein